MNANTIGVLIQCSEQPLSMLPQFSHLLCSWILSSCPPHRRIITPSPVLKRQGWSWAGERRQDRLVGRFVNQDSDPSLHKPRDSHTLLGQFVDPSGVWGQSSQSSQPRNPVLRGHFTEEILSADIDPGLDYNSYEHDLTKLQGDTDHSFEEQLLEDVSSAPQPGSGDLAPVSWTVSGESLDSLDNASTARGFIADILGHVHLKPNEKLKTRNNPNSFYQPPRPSYTPPRPSYNYQPPSLYQPPSPYYPPPSTPAPMQVVLTGVQVQPATNPQPESNKPAFKLANKTSMNLDGPGYALTLLLVGEILILGMAFMSGLGSDKSSRSLRSAEFPDNMESLETFLVQTMASNLLQTWAVDKRVEYT